MSGPASRPASRVGPGDAELDQSQVIAAGRAVVHAALEEDLGDADDVTTLATVPVEQVGTAVVVARQAGVVAGAGLIAEVYARVDPQIRVDLWVTDGALVDAGAVLARITGPLRGILTGERTALNLLGRLSGVATATRRLVDAVAGTGCAIRDTRKTTPGLRLLEKDAVRAGGGTNHRIGLFDALLVKDNHVAAAGGVGAATRLALAGAAGRHVQVEVDSVDQLEEAVEAGARDLLLDNFDPEATLAAVARVRELEPRYGTILLESSGTIGLDTVRRYADAGVDRVSVGAITHSAPQLDVALEVHADGTDPGG